MRGAIVTTLLACIVQIHAEEAQSFDELFQRALMDKLLDKVSALQNTDLDDTTLGKPATMGQPASVQPVGRRQAGLATLGALMPLVAVMVQEKPANAVTAIDIKKPAARDTSIGGRKDDWLTGIERRDAAMTPGSKIKGSEITANKDVNPKGMNQRVIQKDPLSRVTWGPKGFDQAGQYDKDYLKQINNKGTKVPLPK